MLNPLSMLRVQQLYGNPQAVQSDDNTQVMNNQPYINDPGIGQAGVPNTLMQNQSDQTQPANIQDRLKQLYQPKSEASDRFNQMLQNQPKREEPGKLRQIGGILAGLGTARPAGVYNGQPVGFNANPEEAMKVQSAYTDDPYNQKMSDWERRLKPLEYAANQERESNVNQRILAEQALQKEINQQKADEQERANKAREDAITQRNDISRKRAEIAQQRANTYSEISDNKGTIKFDKDGEGWMIYQNGNKKQLDLEQFTPKEIQEFKNEAALKLEHARANDATGLENVKQGNREKSIQQSGEIKKDIKQTAPGTAGEGTEKTVTLFDANGKPQGKSITSTKKLGASGSSNPIKVRMLDPKGNPFTIDASEVEEAKKNGWKVR